MATKKKTTRIDSAESEMERAGIFDLDEPTKKPKKKTTKKKATPKTKPDPSWKNKNISSKDIGRWLIVKEAGLSCEDEKTYLITGYSHSSAQFAIYDPFDGDLFVDPDFFVVVKRGPYVVVPDF